MKSAPVLRLASHPNLRSALAGALFAAVSLCALPFAQGQDTASPARVTSIDLNVSNSGLRLTAPYVSGQNTYQFDDGNGATATMVWNDAADAPSSLSINSLYYGSAAYSWDANAGALVLDSGTDLFIGINHKSDEGGGGEAKITGFQFNGQTYTPDAASTVTLYSNSSHYAGSGGGSATIVMVSGSGAILRWSIQPGDGRTITYRDGASQGHPGSLVRQDGAPANAADTVTSLSLTGGYGPIATVAVSTDSAYLNFSKPCTTFVYGGEVFQLSSLKWKTGHDYGSYLSYGYQSVHGSAAIEWRDGLPQDNNDGGWSISMTSNGQNLWTQYLDGVNSGVDDAFFYNNDYSTGPNDLSMVDGVPYVAQNGYAVPDNQATPAAPISTFEYNGESFALNGIGHWYHGKAVYQFMGANGHTANLSWDPLTNKVTQWNINLDGGHTVTYRPGGQAGSFVLDSANAASENLLGKVDGHAMEHSGYLATRATEDFSVAGNAFNLGQWGTSPLRAAMSLIYGAGQGGSPASLSFVANPPLANWLWGHDGQHNFGSYSGPVWSMEHDMDHRLMLFASPAPSTNTPPAEATVVLDPNAGGTSRFKGKVRFDETVRIEPKGDLSMGTFITEPSAP